MYIHTYTHVSGIRTIFQCHRHFHAVFFLCFFFFCKGERKSMVLSCMSHMCKWMAVSCTYVLDTVLQTNSEVEAREGGQGHGSFPAHPIHPSSNQSPWACCVCCISILSISTPVCRTEWPACCCSIILHTPAIMSSFVPCYILPEFLFQLIFNIIS